MFNVIVLKDGQNWACNSAFRGIFSRKSDGTWLQHIGTCQTPRFKSPSEFSSYIRTKLSHEPERLPRMVSHDWTRT